MMNGAIQKLTALIKHPLTDEADDRFAGTSGDTELGSVPKLFLSGEFWLTPLNVGSELLQFTPASFGFGKDLSGVIVHDAVA